MVAWKMGQTVKPETKKPWTPIRIYPNITNAQNARLSQTPNE